MQPDDTICYCFHVTWRKLENWGRRHRPRVASRFAECGGAGTGCGWCIPFLELIHRRCMGEHNDTCSSDALDTLAPEDYGQLRAAYLHRRQRSDGSDLHQGNDCRPSPPPDQQPGPTEPAVG